MTWRWETRSPPWSKLPSHFLAQPSVLWLTRPVITPCHTIYGRLSSGNFSLHYGLFSAPFYNSPKPVPVKTRATLWAQRGKMEEPLTKQSCSEPQPVALSRPPVACSPARPGWAHSACRRSRCTRTGVPADPRRAGPASRSRARSPARSAAIVTLHNLAKSVKRQLTVLAYICKMPSCKHCRAPFSRRSSVL